MNHTKITFGNFNFSGTWQCWRQLIYYLVIWIFISISQDIKINPEEIQVRRAVECVMVQPLQGLPPKLHCKG